MSTLNVALPSGLAADPPPPRGGDLDESLGKEGASIAVTTHKALTCGQAAVVSPQAQGPERPLQGILEKCIPDATSRLLPKTHGSAHRPPSRPQAASASTGLSGMLRGSGAGWCLRWRRRWQTCLAAGR